MTDLTGLTHPGSAAALSGDIIGRPHLLSSSGPEAMALIRQRLATCLEDHGGMCDVLATGRTIDEQNGVPMPKRVIQMERANYKCCRLTETTSHQRGRYAALSHCWGPPENQPLRTTRGNKEAYMAGIPWGSLPSTFRDALKVTHEALDLDFLWIDSLCTIQDDDQDWNAEAPNMGNIYQNATVTISAAWAQHAGEGLFFDRSAFSVAAEKETASVAYFDRNGNEDGTFQAAAAVTELSVTTEIYSVTPLAKRAWVLQEEKLSRRTVYFTKRDIVWECKRHVLSETNCSSPITRELFVPSVAHWPRLVTDYTARSLTFAKDKLAALAGLANLIAQSSPHDVYQHGVWQSQLASHLLWLRKESLRANADMRAPSWSWASTMGPLSFIETDHVQPTQDELEHPLPPLEITDEDELRTVATPMPVRFVSSHEKLPNYGENLEKFFQDVAKGDASIGGYMCPWYRPQSHQEREAAAASSIRLKTIEVPAKLLAITSPLHEVLPFNDTCFLIAGPSKAVLGYCSLDLVGDSRPPAEGAELWLLCVYRGYVSGLTPGPTIQNRYHFCLVLEDAPAGAMDGGSKIEPNRYNRKGVALMVVPPEYFTTCFQPTRITVV